MKRPAQTLVVLVLLLFPLMDLAAQVRVTRDLAFAVQPLLSAPGFTIELALDLYLPAARDQPYPVVVLCHGGSYITGDKQDVGGLADDLARRGIASVAINYRLGSVPDAGTQTEAVSMVYDDVLAAFSWVATHAQSYNLDSDRVYVGGNSSGGHMTIATAVLYPQEASPLVHLRGAIDLYGGYFTENLSAEAAPLLILQGTADFTCRPEASRTMAGLYKKAGAWCRLFLLDGMNHDWSHPTYRGKLVALMDEFISQTSDPRFATSPLSAVEVLVP